MHQYDQHNLILFSEIHPTFLFQFKRAIKSSKEANFAAISVNTPRDALSSSIFYGVNIKGGLLELVDLKPAVMFIIEVIQC